MNFADVLFWMAGVSWLLTGILALQRARIGDRSLLRYFGMVALVAVPLCAAFPTAIAWILGLLWIVTLVIPGLLFRRLQTLSLQRRFSAILVIGRWLTVLHPVGPYANAAKLMRYQCLRELGRNTEAETMAAGFGKLPQAQQRQMTLIVLRSEQRWHDMITTLEGRPVAEAAPFRMRALAETGDLPGMLADFHSIAGTLESQRSQYLQALAVILAFGGRRELVEGLMMDAAPAIRVFWSATACWANGEETRARQMLEAIRDSDQPCLDAAIAWRLAHPPASVGTLSQVVREQIDRVAEAASRSRVLSVGRPWITWAILAICVTMFCITESANNHIEALWKAGAFDPSLGWIGNSWRFIASDFLHVNVIHILMNGISLLFLAPGLERTLRWFRFLVLYLGAAIGGMSLVQICWYASDGRPEIVVGASASIMGLVGADLVRILRGRVAENRWWRHPQIRRIGLMLAIQIAFDLCHPTVSQAGHIGGFLIGFVLAWLLMPRGRRAGRIES